MRGAIVIVAALVGCGSGTPPPPEVRVTIDARTNLIVATNPLSLRVERDGQVVLQEGAFVEVGVADGFLAQRYYDPAAPKGVRFRVAQRATAWDAQANALTLALDGDGGGAATLIVAGDGLVLATANVPNAVLARFVLPLDATEELYGFGETYDSPAARGVVREMQLRLNVTADAGTNEVHVPVPLAIYPGRALGFFAEEKRPGAFDVGAARADAVLATFATASLTLHLYDGAPLDVLDAYTQKTGRPLAPPDWAMAPMQWRNEAASAAQVLDDATQMRANGIPGSTIWIDNPWQTGYNTFGFDARFGDPTQLVAQLAALGYKLVVWSTPYVDAAAPTDGDHAEAAAGGFLITDEHGKPFDWPWQNGPGALVDFTANGATAWWQERIARVTDLGVAGFKLDFGEDLVPEIGGMRTPFHLAAGGTDEWHNAYAGVYHDAYLSKLGAGGFLITRAGAWGTQAHTTCVWPGDLDRDFSRHSTTHSGGLPSAIAAGLSLGASGFPSFGSDIGGFRGGLPTSETLVRWAEYAALSPVMQLGGGGDSHNPWDPMLFTAEALADYAKYARLHTDLFPYLYTLALDAAASGAPPMRAPGLIVPGHPYQDDFFVGDALFVAPVVEDGARTRTVTLPPGDWNDWWTGVAVAGGAPITVDAPLDTLPLWRRTGALVPLLDVPIDTLAPASAAGVRSFADPATPGRLRVVVTPAGSASLPIYDGTQLGVAVAGAAVTVTVAGAPTRFGEITFALDWNHSALAAAPPTTGSVPLVADALALAACAAGCWRWDPVAGIAYVRLVGAGSATIQ